MTALPFGEKIKLDLDEKKRPSAEQDRNRNGLQILGLESPQNKIRSRQQNETLTGRRSERHASFSRVDLSAPNGEHSYLDIFLQFEIGCGF